MKTNTKRNQSAGIDEYKYKHKKYIEEKKTFDAFVMILCVRDWLMPGGDSQAEKMAFQSDFFLHIAMGFLIEDLMGDRITYATF